MKALIAVLSGVMFLVGNISRTTENHSCPAGSIHHRPSQIISGVYYSYSSAFGPSHFHE